MRRTENPVVSLGLNATACRLLSPASGSLEPPVRAVIFGAARFAEHGRSLALAQEVTAAGETSASFFPRLRQNLEMLADARKLLESHARLGHHLAPAAGWLIDHAHLLESQLSTVRRGLPKSYYAELPRLRDEPPAHPRWVPGAGRSRSIPTCRAANRFDPDRRSAPWSSASPAG